MKNFNEFSFIRHGEKMKVGEERKPLKESGLTKEQQAKWQKAIDVLKLEDPELAYDALPKIEKMAKKIFDSLPDKALLIFIPTDTPKTKLTCSFLSSEIIDLSLDNEKKDIAVSYLLEPAQDSKEPESLKGNLGGDMMHLMDKIRERDFQDDELLKRYFKEAGNKSIPFEDELVMMAVNEDLNSENSYFRQRAKLFLEQYEKLKVDFQDETRPIYFYGVTHHSALMALDVGFNGREKYNSVDEIPKPLSLWKANLSQKS